MPAHIPLSSLEALTSPAELSRLLERPVETVVRTPVESAQTSTEATFLRLELDAGAGPRLFVKVVDPVLDWVALVTRDEQRRAVALGMTSRSRLAMAGLCQPVVRRADV